MMRETLRQTALRMTTPNPCPSADELLYIQGLQASQAGDRLRALELLSKALQAQPTRGDIAYNYGVVLQQAGFMDQAIAAWQQSTSLSPEHAVAWANLALAFSISGQHDQALQTYRQGLGFHPENRDLLYNHANLLVRQSAYEEALHAYQTLLKTHPNDTASLINAAKTAKTLGLYDLSESFYERAIGLGGPHLPHAHFNRANLYLRQSKWAQGFADYEWRLQLPDALPAPWGLPAYHNGLPQGSHILLWSDQGLGDALMYLRFLPRLLERGHRVSLFVQTPLKPLLNGYPDVQAVYDPSDAPATMDAAIALGSLPHLLQLAPASGWYGPYIQTQGISPLVSGGQTRRIGLVWAGNPKHENDRNRSLKLENLAPLFAVKGKEWISLQYGSHADDIAKTGLQDKLHNAAPLLTDMGVTASLMQTLDLVITVDTATAHLAGAMGKAVWTLLPAIDSDWRWGLTGDTTFWYPSMTLFRQKQPATWDDIVQDMVSQLEERRENAA